MSKGLPHRVGPPVGRNAQDPTGHARIGAVERQDGDGRPRATPLPIKALGDRGRSRATWCVLCLQNPRREEDILCYRPPPRACCAPAPASRSLSTSPPPAPWGGYPKAASTPPPVCISATSSAT